MAKEHAKVAGPDLAIKFMNEMFARGLAPPNITRMIIDLRCDTFPCVYYETVGCEQMFSLDLATLVENAEITIVDKPDDTK